MFDDALELDRTSHVAAAGFVRATKMLGIVSGTMFTGWRIAPPRGSQKVAWPEAAERGHALEAERAFQEALTYYFHAIADSSNEALIFTAMARCYLALGMAPQAVDYAQRALAVKSKHLEAHSIRARGYQLLHKYEDALKCAGVWLAIDPADPSAHYTRGRALLALGRFLEARDAFDRACAIKPGMLEAMLLRTEAERAAARVRDAVGEQPALVIDLPERLAELREPLVGGRIAEMIAILVRPTYAGDAIATLVLARCLAFDGRFEDAVSTYDRVATLSPEHEREASLGKAHALLGLDRADEALIVFERVGAGAADLDAIEGRALALEQLGRADEADELLRTVVSTSGSRSSLRVASLRR
jgi:tetratricopeptide (TPR) repeat protein